MLKKRYFLILFSLLITISSLYVFRLFGAQNKAITNFVYLLPPLIAAVCGFYAAGMYGIKNLHGRALLMISIGLLSWFIGESIWFYLRIIVDVDPFPSLADGFYLLGYPFLFFGLITELKQEKLNLKSVNAFTLSLVAFFGLLLTFSVAYFGVYRAYNPDESFFSNLISIGYGLGDLLLIVPSLLILKNTVDYGKGKLFWPWMLIFDAFILTLVADILFATYTSQYQEVVFPYNLIDLVWATAYLVFAYGFSGITEAIRDVQNELFYSNLDDQSSSVSKK